MRLQVQCPQLLMPSKDDAPSVKLGGLAENTLKDVKIIGRVFYRKCKLPLDPSCPSVGLLVGGSVCHSFKNGAGSYTSMLGALV